MEYNNLLIEHDNEIVTVTINRPKALNALNDAVMQELECAFKQLKDEQAKPVILTGSGEKAFVAGADVAAMSKMNAEQAKAFGRLGHRVLSVIENYPGPVIAAINGYTFGGGCELCLVCDIRVASDQAKFGWPEVNLGIMCGWGATQRLPHLVGKGKAKELLFSGDTIDAATAQQIGLVERVVSAAQLDDKVRQLARQLANKPRIALAMAKKAINMSGEVSLPEGLHTELDCFANTFMTEDQKEGMDAFLNKRKPIFKGK